jgi:hypothetical protein
MKHGLISYSAAFLAALWMAPLAAWADTNPDFDDDAKPILKMQPGLIRYVESRFEVKSTGTAKYPGDDDHPPGPPYIFRARPLGSHGPYNLRLLIQPGEPGHILGVVDITKAHLTNPGNPASGPSVANRPPEVEPFGPEQPQMPEPPPQQEPAEAQAPAPSSVQVPELSAGPVAQQPQPSTPAQAPQAPAQQAPAAQQPTQPTADTPSGPILDSNGQGSPNSGQPSLQPPPDPAPTGQ